MPKGTEDHVGFFAPQSKHIYSKPSVSMAEHLDYHIAGARSTAKAPLTLFAGFAFSLAKMFCDSVLVASAMVATDSNSAGVAVCMGGIGEMVGTSFWGRGSAMDAPACWPLSHVGGATVGPPDLFPAGRGLPSNIMQLPW